MKFKAGDEVKLSAEGLVTVGSPDWMGDDWKLEEPDMVGTVVEDVDGAFVRVRFPQTPPDLWPMSESELELIKEA